jgi:hypothetical protein
MQGILNLQRISNDGSTIARYQVRYEDLAGNSFVGSMDEQDLHELLYHKLPMAMADDQLDNSYQRLKQNGRLTMQELEFDENTLAGAGLTFLPAEG